MISLKKIIFLKFWLICLRAYLDFFWYPDPDPDADPGQWYGSETLLKILLIITQDFNLFLLFSFIFYIGSFRHHQSRRPNLNTLGLHLPPASNPNAWNIFTPTYMLIHVVPEPVFSLCFEVALVTEAEGSVVSSVDVAHQQMLEEHTDII